MRTLFVGLVCWLAAALLGTPAALGAGAGGSGTVALDYWHFYSGVIGDLHNELVDEFNATHPHIHVRSIYGGSAWTMRDKLFTALAAGGGPDVASIDQFWIAQLADEGLVVPVEPLAVNDPDFDAADILPVFWETGQYDGKLLAAPFVASNVLLFYNVDLMESLGLSENDVPTRWDDLLALGDRLPLDDPGFQRRTWVLDVPTTMQTGVVYYFLITLWQHGGELFTPDMKAVAFDSDAGRETLELWRRLIDTGLLDLKRPDKAWESGRSLFHIASSARFTSIYKDLPFNVGVAPLPRARFRATGIGGRNLAIFSREEEKIEAAWTFIKWMTSADVNRRWSERTGYSPLRRSTFSSDEFQRFLEADPRVEVALKEMLYARSRPNIEPYGDVSRILGEAVEEALYLNLDPAEALADAAKRANARLAQ